MEHTDSSIQKLNEKMIDARTSAKKRILLVLSMDGGPVAPL